MRTAFVLAAAPVVLAGCLATTPAADDPLMARLAEIERRLESVERVVRNQSLVSMSQQVTALQRSVDSLQGTTEELEYNASSTADRQRDLYADLDTRIQALAERLNAVGTVAPAPEEPNVPLLNTGTDQENYQAAFQLLREKQYAPAAAAFERFLVMFPESPLASNAQYWLGEAHYVTQAFDEALTAFRRVVDGYPGSPKVADALLKIGYVHYENENFADARSTLEQVQREYPDSAPARLAAQRLERMDGEGV